MGRLMQRRSARTPVTRRPGAVACPERSSLRTRMTSASRALSGSVGIVVAPPPPGHQDADLCKRRERGLVEEFVPEPGIKAGYIPLTYACLNRRYVP
jgi:hypothetical protein